jgi:hypothetical protein
MTVTEVLRMLEESPTVPLWPEAGKALGLKRGQTYKAAARGEIKTIEMGRIKRVTTSWLRKKLDLDEVAA